MWLRADLRRSGRALLVLTLLVLASTSTVLSAFEGARRGASSLDRLSRRTLPATVVVLPNTPGFDWKPIEQLPEVEALTRFAVDYAIAVDGLPGDVIGFPPADSNTFATVERPVMFEGRVFNPHRADEVVVTPGLARNFHLSVGDHVTIQLPTKAERADEDAPASRTFHGPRVDATIVGVGMSSWFSDNPASKGALILSPGLAEHFPDEVLGDQSDPAGFAAVNALVRLRGGEAAIPAFRRDLTRVTGREIDVWDRPAQDRIAQRTLRFEALCLAGLGLVALAAAAFIVGQAISRHCAASVDELRSTIALGMTTDQVQRLAALPVVVGGVVGSLSAIPVAWLISSRFPIGLAGMLEPAPGRASDWVVTGLGVLASIGLVGFAAFFSSRRGLRTVAPMRPPSRLAEALCRGGWPVSTLIGVRFAFEPGQGGTSVPVRSAIAGAVVGLMGVTGGFTFSAAVHDATVNPSRFGQTFDMGAMVGFNGQEGPVGNLVTALAGRPEVEAAMRARMAVADDLAGRSSVSLYAFEGGPKPISPVVTSGRMPRSDDEVALAPRSRADLGVAVGDEVTLVGDRGRASYRVTGVAFVPAGPHNGYADGGWVSPGGYDRLFAGFKFDSVLIATRPGTDPARLSADLVTSDSSLEGLQIDRVDPVDEVAILRQVEVLPTALGAFLVVLALGAVGHALASAVRRRSGTLAVLRALGMTPRQCRAAVVTQSTVLAIVGLLMGLPLGVVLGRVLWRVVADYLPVAYVAPFPALALVLTVPAALVAVNVLGVWPGHRAARTRVQALLRRE